MTDLPSFIVLSGENGAGKSHLLQGIADGKIAGDWEGGNSAVRLLDTTRLGNPPEPTPSYGQRESVVSQFENRIEQLQWIRHNPHFPDPNQEVLDNLAINGLPHEISRQIQDRAGRPFLEWTHDTFVEYTPSELGNGDLFSLSLSETFDLYNQIITGNAVNQVLKDAGESHGRIRSRDELHDTFGKPPWDLLNSALESVGLTYRFKAPTPAVVPSNQTPRLEHISSGESYPISELSSGERTLMTVAMSLYSATNRKDYLRLPKVVLLDEPDATLHPSMISSLIELLSKHFVRDLGINVIMTTHSPTTVALARQESLFIMRKTESPRLVPAVSTDAALKNLLVGVPTLSVSSDNRRTVLVESPQDEKRYTAIATLLSDQLVSERSLVFMAAGSKSLANGSAAVIDLVHRLRANGNHAVWGLIDRDTRTQPPSEHVTYDSSRYTIENLILDPMSVGYFLLLENYEPLKRVVSGVDYLNFNPLEHGQALVDFVVAQVSIPGDTDSRSQVTYVGGFDASLPDAWMTQPGHTLTNLVVTGIGILRRYEQSHDRLLEDIVSRVWAPRPQLVPASLADTLRDLLQRD